MIKEINQDYEAFTEGDIQITTERSLFTDRFSNLNCSQQKEIKKMEIVLEYYKLELTQVLPIVERIVKKAKKKSQSKPNVMIKTQRQINKILSKVRVQVIEEQGQLIDCNNEESFEQKIDKLLILQVSQIFDLKMQIESAINKAKDGSDSNLSIELEDKNLNADMYSQLVSKVYSTIRFKIYQEIKKRTNGFQNKQLNDKDLTEIIKELDVESIRSDVFKLYGISPGLDTQLTLRKAQYLHSNNDEMFQNYLVCLKEAHERFLGYILQGCRMQKMEQNPLHSKDLNYGVPLLFTEILDQLLDDTHQIHNQMYEQNQQQMIVKLNKSKGKHQENLDMQRGKSQKQESHLEELTPFQSPERQRQKSSNPNNQQESEFNIVFAQNDQQKNESGQLKIEFTHSEGQENQKRNSKHQKRQTQTYSLKKHLFLDVCNKQETESQNQKNNNQQMMDLNSSRMSQIILKSPKIELAGYFSKISAEPLLTSKSNNIGQVFFSNDKQIQKLLEEDEQEEMFMHLEQRKRKQNNYREVEDDDDDEEEVKQKEDNFQYFKMQSHIENNSHIQQWSEEDNERQNNYTLFSL